ncbi:hypothetical protein DHW03_10590 [Pedobacter yonginense]|uniref:histidine kinase n=1 Tax=Pedobacter yonginense TaxID=651869 RepID=A0A317EMG3_9SPHI|nr:GAF domain-containing sensor histidine kinase [Pedobacter yonginense]PWS28001.1 hypothetical protein DHW03_10590 [Pedobacter yonginense]
MIIPGKPANEIERLKAIESYQIDSWGAEQDFDELTLLAAEICQTPIALVTILGEDKQWFKSSFGTDLKESAREVAFCSHAILNDREIMVVNDARKDERFVNNPLVTGDTRIVFYAGVPLVNPEGYALGTICVIDHEEKDLSENQLRALRILGKQALHQIELRRKLQELEKANLALVEANTFIEKFAHRVAHDIKNPLTSIIMAADSIQKKFDSEGDDRSVRLINIALRSARNLVTYVDDMLDYSKKPASLLTAHETFELDELFERILPMLNAPQECKISLSNSAKIKSSKIALEQILLNLLSNSIRYNNKSQPEIELCFREDHSQYYFSVKDNGRGIEKDQLDKIFEEGFTSVEKDRFGKKGNGLGLDAVSSLVKKMQGKIHASSEIEKGTTISFSLPR